MTRKSFASLPTFAYSRQWLGQGRGQEAQPPNPPDEA